MANSNMQGRMPFAYPSFIFLFLISINISFAQQSLCFESVNTFDSDMQGSVYKTVFDSEGNSYSIGSFLGEVGFGSSDNVQTLVSYGSSDVFLSKYNAMGEFLWVKHFGNSEDNEFEFLDIDAENNLYISGSYTGQMDFNPNSGIANASSTGERDLFVLKLDSNGAFEWALQLEDNEESIPSDMKVSSDGFIYLSMTFSGEQDVNMGPGETLVSDTNGQTCVFRLNRFGDLDWHYQLKGFYTQIETDHENNLIITGNFNEEFDFDPSSENNILTPSSNQSDCFILKFSDAHELLWSGQIEGNSIKEIYDVTSDPDGNIIYTGYFVGITDLDPSSGTHQINSSVGPDAFLSKLSPNGEHIFTKDFGVTSPCNGENVACDIDGDIYLSGFFLLDMDFNPNSGEFIMTNNDFGNHFVLKLGALGNFVYAKQLEGNQPINGFDLTVNNDKRVILSGGYNGTVDFNPNEDLFEHTTSSGNSFVLTLFQEERVQISEMICKAFLSPSEQYVWTEPGNYLDTTLSVDGCITVYEIELFKISDQVLTTNDGSAIYAWEDDATYQWFKCGANVELIEGATDRYFQPEEHGLYKVQVSKDGCSQFSNCIEFQPSEIISSTNDLMENGFLVYPNPSSSDFNIVFNQSQENIQIRIYNSIGQVIHEAAFSNKTSLTLEADFEAGIYFIELNGDNQLRKKIIKQ